MRAYKSERRTSGFTAIELFFVIGTVLLVMLVLPAATRCGGRSPRIACTSNQKQIGLAFRMWANDNGEKFPMHLSTAEGGTKETALQGLPLASFSIISNELNNPKPLTCPADTSRTRVSTFPQLNPRALSYFIGIDASETNPASILGGDRNLCVNSRRTNRFVVITNYGTVTWGSRIHTHEGNIVLADGSAHQTTDLLLQKALQSSGAFTNRFVIP